ncbi:hypothetical protein GGP96_003210 [Salinibacter ruber]|nr:hypothetical protein [Salinibacter ruber]
MPNGGHDNCANCRHFEYSEPFNRENPEDWRCSLREVQLEGDPYWTTCDNFGEDITEPSGSVHAITGYVEDEAISYVRLPYYDGNRPETHRSQGEDSTILVKVGEENKRFETPRAYLDFCAE